jgi:hypothetical protein
MAKKRRITSAERRHMDYLRKKGLAVGKVYEGKLLKARRAEVKRVLMMCRDYSDPEQWPAVIESALDEGGYYYDWMRGLYLNAGLPRAKSITRELSRSKAEDPSGMWEQELAAFAQSRAGENIVSVSGSLKDELVKLLRTRMTEDGAIGVEKLTQLVFSDYGKVAEWMVRRIAQTETMIGLAEAGAVAADTLDVGFTKQWCISGIRTRESHAAMDGVEVDQNELFILPDCQMRWPHDDAFGAPAGEIINCACDIIRRPK